MLHLPLRLPIAAALLMVTAPVLRKPARWVRRWVGGKARDGGRAWARRGVAIAIGLFDFELCRGPGVRGEVGEEPNPNGRDVTFLLFSPVFY